MLEESRQPRPVVFVESAVVGPHNGQDCDADCKDAAGDGLEDYAVAGDGLS